MTKMASLSKSETRFVVCEITLSPHCLQHYNHDQCLVFQQAIRESENPTWVDQIRVNYYFEQSQQVVLRVYDQDKKADLNQLDKHQLIGEATFLLSNLMCAPGQTARCNLTGPRAKGVVDVRGEPLANTNDVFVCTFAGHKLVNKDGFFGRSDPFLTISRSVCRCDCAIVPNIIELYWV
jgi:hypothetical protein